MKVNDKAYTFDESTASGTPAAAAASSPRTWNSRASSAAISCIPRPGAWAGWRRSSATGSPTFSCKKTGLRHRRLLFLPGRRPRLVYTAGPQPPPSGAVRGGALLGRHRLEQADLLKGANALAGQAFEHLDMHADRYVKVTAGEETREDEARASCGSGWPTGTTSRWQRAAISRCAGPTSIDRPPRMPCNTSILMRDMIKYFISRMKIVG